jgi:RNA polymerase sigma factor (sigma-70 family)
MTNSPEALDALAADFQRHGQWLQRLADGMVLDASEADDLLQDAWLAAAGAVRRPASPGRAWLAGVLSNVARAGRRSAGRRRARESRVVARQLEERALAVSSEERVAREQQLLALVAALPASQRDVIVARYFDDLSPAAIARREGLSVDAVKSRLKRGLEALRARIGEDGSGSYGVALWLVPLARGGRRPLRSGGALLGAGGVAAAALVGVATFGPWAPAQRGSIPTDASAANTERATEPAVDPIVAVSPPWTRAARSPVEVVTRPQTASKECRIHGRIVDIDGAPLRRARIVAHGSRASSEREQVYGLPTHWQDPEVLTDENGAFELRFVPPQALPVLRERPTRRVRRPRLALGADPRGRGAGPGHRRAAEACLDRGPCRGRRRGAPGRFLARPGEASRWAAGARGSQDENRRRRPRDRSFCLRRPASGQGPRRGDPHTGRSRRCAPLGDDDR